MAAPANVPGTQNLNHGVTFGDMRTFQVRSSSLTVSRMRNLMRPNRIVIALSNNAMCT